MREWLNQNAAMVTVVAVVILVVALGLVVWNMSAGPAGTNLDYFYDPNTKQVISDKVDRLPPFELSTGSEQAVGAVVYACGDACGDESQRKVGYLWRYTPKGVELAQEIATLGQSQADLERQTELNQQIELEKQYRKPDSDKWMEDDDPEAEDLLTAIYRNCPSSQKTTLCVPQ